MGTFPIFKTARNGECPHFDVLIVGGGHAGAQAAIVLRSLKFAGSVAIVTEEPEFPYERPPLSKDYLAGVKPFDRLWLRPPAFWTERDIRIATDQRVVAVDPIRKRAQLADGRTLGYGTLIWAAGGRARQLTAPGAQLKGVHAIRSRADIDAITARLDEVRNVVVVGGGYIGLESASVLRKLDKNVTVVEMQARLLSRVAGTVLAEFYAAEHQRHAVTIQTNVTIERIEGNAQGVCGVRLSSGEVLSADLVIVGIGIIPNIEPLIAAGAVATNGVHVDALCRTSIDDVYAIGDCAAHVNAFAGGERIRLESVQNANEQATCVAKTLCGQPTQYNAVPWFWSDQYDLKLQIAGLSLGHDTTIVRGDPATRSFAVAYLKRDQLVALDCVNATRDYVQGRKLIADGAKPEASALADADIQLKDVPLRAN